jgi:hypothetical protein
MKRTIASILLLLLVPALGCASLQNVTSGQIGCPAEEIQIVSDEAGWGTRTWTAQCHGKTYYCSAHGGGQYSTPQVSCKEQSDKAGAPAPAAPAAPPAGGGCQFDAQCKGDRICKQGACVDPTPK